MLHNVVNVFLLSFLVSSCDSSTSSKTQPPPIDPTETPTTESPVKSEGEGEGAEEVSVENSVAEINLTGIKSLLPTGLTIDREKFLTNTGNDLAVRAKNFRIQAENMIASADIYCSSPGEQADLQKLQAQWQQTMGMWQHFEVFQVGPILENAGALKSNIYLWPDLADLCKIDEEVLKASKSTSYKLPPVKTRKGMGALEYLIFESTYAGRCPASSATAQEWNTLDSTQKISARCAYIKPLAKAIAEQASQLENRWGTPGDNHFTRAIGDEVLEQQAIQQLYDAFFYVDLRVKNQKLAAPAGLDAKHCRNFPNACLDRAEFQFADFSREAIDLNFQAMMDIFFGPGPDRLGGLSSVVREQGGNDAATRTEENLITLDKVLQTEQDLSLSELVSRRKNENCDNSTKSWLCKTRSLIRIVAADLKQEYLQILKVKMPAEAAQDND